MLDEGDGAQSLPVMVVILGPTAVGKTELSVRLAEVLDGEIISADSRQVYRYMDIGTAKPTPEQRSRVPHHLIDIITPDQTLTLAQYQEMAYRVIAEVISRGHLPLLVGGTGLYIQAVTEGWTVPRVAPNPALRARLRALAEREGPDVLHARLFAVDPVAAERIDPRNVRRVVRALEVYEITGTPISELQHKRPPPYRILRIGLTMKRAELYRRIDARVDAMMAEGLLEEVKGLVARGYDFDLPAMSGLGYRQIGMYLRGEIDLEEAVRLIKRDTRRFVRRQYNWFRPSDERIHWFDVEDDPFKSILRLIENLR